MKKHSVIAVWLAVWCIAGNASEAPSISKVPAIFSKPCLALDAQGAEIWKQYNSFVKNFLRDKPFYAITRGECIEGIWTHFSPYEMKDAFAANMISKTGGIEIDHSAHWLKRYGAAKVIGVLGAAGGVCWVAHQYQMLPQALVMGGVSSAIALGVCYSQRKGAHNKAINKGSLPSREVIPSSNSVGTAEFQRVLDVYFALSATEPAALPLKQQQNGYYYLLRSNGPWLRSFKNLSKFKATYPKITCIACDK